MRHELVEWSKGAFSLFPPFPPVQNRFLTTDFMDDTDKKPRSSKSEVRNKFQGFKFKDSKP